MALKDYSTTAGTNDGLGVFDEGQAPNAVNDGGRTLMADVRAFYENIEWRNWGHTPARIDATNFYVAGSDETGVYIVDRRVKMVDGTSGTIYGTITVTDYNNTRAGDTTVTVAWDSTQMAGTLSAVSVGVDTSNNPIHAKGIFGLNTKGADIASATTLAIGTDGDYFDVTGTTSITALSGGYVGQVVRLHFDGALTLTHHATNLVLPGGVDITTVAGDEAEFLQYATDDWRCTNYQTYQKIPSISFVPVYIGKITWSAGTPSVAASLGGAPSLTAYGTGDVKLTWSGAFSDTNYFVSITHEAAGSVPIALGIRNLGQTADAIRVTFQDVSGTPTDPAAMHYQAWGTLA